MIPSLHTIDLILGPEGLSIEWPGGAGELPQRVPPAMRARVEHDCARLDTAEYIGELPAIAAAQRQLGETLFALLDGPERALQRWLAVTRARREPLHLVLRLRALDPEKLVHHPALGWHLQLLTSASEEPLALQPDITLTVQFGGSETASPELLEEGGLQLLFMASSPRDVEPVLDYEAEEEHFLEQLAPFVEQRRIMVHVAEEGSLAELERRLKGRRYDIVHLSGHGILTQQGPRLLMEDEVGGRDEISPAQLLEAFGNGHMPRLVVLSSCHTAEQRAELPSLAAELLHGGVPSVVGWTRPVGDAVATRAAAMLYRELCNGEPPTQALAHARRGIYQESFQQRLPPDAWATLQLLTRQPAGFVINPRQGQPPEERPAPEVAYQWLGGRMRVLQQGFVGRRRELQALGRVLRWDRGSARREDEAPVAGAVVIGMKGQGKSCLAGRALERLRHATGQLSLVVLHGQLDDVSLAESFHTVASEADDAAALAVLSDGSQLPLTRIKRLLHGDWREKRLVIVLDGFESNLAIPAEGPASLSRLAEEILEVLVPACQHGLPKLLLTSTAGVAMTAHGPGVLVELALGALDSSSVRKLLFRGPPGQLLIYGISPDAWMALSERLGRNARLLDWAQQLLSGKTPTEVREVAARAGQQLPVWTQSDVDEANRDELVALFLKDMAFEEARARVGPTALTFIERARVYEEPVPAKALEGLTEGLPMSLGHQLVALANLGLLEVGSEDGTVVYRVSPLVKEKFDAPDGARWHALAADYWWKGAKRNGLWHVFSLIQAWRHAVQAGQQALADTIADPLSRGLDALGLYAESVRLGSQHLKAFPESVAGLLWAGDAQDQAGQPREGLLRVERAVELCMTLPAEFERLTEARLLLARIKRGLGAYAEARQQLEALVAAEEQAHPEGSRPLARALHGLAMVRRAQGEVPAARALLERSISLTRRMLGTQEDMGLASQLHSLAQVVREQGELPAARALLERSLAMTVKVLRTEAHPSVAVSLHELAMVLQLQGELPAARALLERSIAIKRKVLGSEEHPDFSSSFHALAGVLTAQGELREAGDLLERSRAIQRKVLGSEEHLGIAATLHALGGVRRRQGMLSEAHTLLERSIAIKRRIFRTEEHPDIASSLYDLALVLHDQGALPEARALLERSLAIKKGFFGTEEHPSFCASLFALAAISRTQGALPEARALLERALAINRKFFGTEEHLDIAAIYSGLGSCLRGMGLLDESEKAVRKEIEILERVFQTRDHVMLAEAEVHLADLLTIRGRWQEAIPLIQHATPVLRAKAPDHPFLPELRKITSSPEIDAGQLAHMALSARKVGGALPEALLAGLESLRSAGAPHNRIADFLEKVARGGPLPLAPYGLPEGVARFVETVLRLAEEGSS